VSKNKTKEEGVKGDEGGRIGGMCKLQIVFYGFKL